MEGYEGSVGVNYASQETLVASEVVMSLPSLHLLLVPYVNFSLHTVVMELEEHTTPCYELICSVSYPQKSFGNRGALMCVTPPRHATHRAHRAHWGGHIGRTGAGAVGLREGLRRGGASGSRMALRLVQYYLCVKSRSLCNQDLKHRG